MRKTKKILAFIGARGGSKGLKNKNIIDFGGRPLIARSIQAALDSQYIERVLVSTDSEQIAQVAKEAGADVPFLRPAEFARDASLIEEAIRHGLTWMEEKEKQVYDYVLLLQPTSPLRTTAHIDAAIRYYFDHKKTAEDTLISVIEASEKMGWLMETQAGGYIDFCFGLGKDKLRRQDIPNYYLPNGAIFISPVKVIMAQDFHTTQKIPFVMEPAVSVDIDSAQDLERAQAALKAQPQEVCDHE